MDWHSWSPAPFRTAVETGRPVLLLLTTRWSGGCARMERDALEDPRVCAIVEREYVAVRVDADLRPDVADRYSLGGWPSTLLLTGEGDVLQGGTYFDAPALADLLERTSAVYRADRRAIAGRARVAKAERLQQRAIVGVGRTTHSLLPEDILQALLARTDPAGGFAGAPKFLHEDAILFFLKSGSAAAVDAARRALDVARRVLIRPTGEACRCAAGAGWTDAVAEATPDSQAIAIRVFAEASAQLDRGYLEPLRALVTFARAQWLDGRTALLTTDVAANMASASLAAAHVLDDATFGRSALALLERAALSTYRPGAGVRHCDGEDAPDLLADHVSTIAALLDAHEATGELPYSMLAEELGHRLVNAFMDEDAGALRDRVHAPGDVGRLSEPLHPFVLNAHAAQTLGRLASVSGEPSFTERAAALFGWAAARHGDHDLDAAACGLAALDLINWRHS